MKNLIFSALLFLILCPLSFGQNPNCPKLSVTGPSARVQPGETLTFTANIEESGSDLDKITYQWSVDKGTIIEGQGTPTILVSTEGLTDAAVTAAVEIKGLTADCAISDSETGVVAGGCGYFVVDEFGRIPKNDEKARLDVLVAELTAKKEFIAYIILYHPANKKSYENKVARIRNFLVKDRGIASERLVFIPGGIEQEERVKLFLIPKDSVPPTP